MEKGIAYGQRPFLERDPSDGRPPDLNDELCHRCRKLDLGSYVEMRTMQGRGTIAFIERISLRKDCELCSQFDCIFKTLKPVRSKASVYESFTLDFRSIHIGSWTGVYFRVRFMEFKQVLDFDLDFYPMTASNTGATSEVSPLAICRKMTVNSDIKLAKRWLDECRSCHEQCQHVRARPSRLRVIDCREKRLRCIDASVPYACLSYVWGNQPTIEQVDSDGSLQNVPLTITDAMLVTINLGLSFLWVDRYCIDQSNPDEKHSIIRNMDQIYRSADITIVASTGSNPQQGLPGVSNTPRRQQLYLKAGKHTFASTENIREQINTSAWNSRGWTYQEMLLSRRRLVFTASQMYFQCVYASFLESMFMSATISYSSLRTTFSTFPRNPGNSYMDTTQDRLVEYYQRNLSVKADAIHAFSGIFNSPLAMEGQQVSRTHFYGIPIQRSYHNFNDQLQSFVQALAWIIMHRDSALKPLEFPLIFPSWSWASVKARYTSNGPTGEYLKPPNFMVSPSDFQIRISVYRNFSMDLKHYWFQSKNYTTFEPKLIITGHILSGAFESIAPFGGIYLDGTEDPNFSNVVALFLGRTRVDFSVASIYQVPQNCKTYCLMLERVKPQQPSTGSERYRRIGLWIQHVPELQFSSMSSAQIRDLMCKKLPGGQEKWVWSKQTFDLL